jgi:hypothetical protein
MSELEEEIEILNGFKRMLNRKIRNELRSETSDLDSLTGYVEMRIQLSDRVSVLRKELNQKQTFSTTSGYKKGY